MTLQWARRVLSQHPFHKHAKNCEELQALCFELSNEFFRDFKLKMECSLTLNLVIYFKINFYGCDAVWTCLGLGLYSVSTFRFLGLVFFSVSSGLRQDLVSAWSRALLFFKPSISISLIATIAADTLSHLWAASASSRRRKQLSRGEKYHARTKGTSNPPTGSRHLLLRQASPSSSLTERRWLKRLLYVQTAITEVLSLST